MNKFFHIVVAALLGLGLTACADFSRSKLAVPRYPGPMPSEHVYEDFILVKAKVGDSLASLAAKYYDDPHKDWLIAEFNQVHTVTPGQHMIVPSKPLRLGGLAADGHQTVPVLFYAEAVPKKNGAETFDVNRFEAHLAFLADNGYRPVTLEQFFEFLNYKSPLPRRAVVLTFDWAPDTFYGTLYPLLASYGFPATLFIRPTVAPAPTPLRQAVATMAADNISIQSRTLSGCDLSRLKKGESFRAYINRIEHELATSRKQIEHLTGRSCRYLAYPAGRTSPLVVAFLKKHGYEGAFLASMGSTPFFAGNYRVQRIRLNAKTDAAQLQKKLKIFHKQNDS